MFLVSDDMRRLRPERQRYIAALLPVLGESAYAPGWLEHDMPDVFVLPRPGTGDLGPWVVAGIFNWKDETRDHEVSLEGLGLDTGQAHWAAEFWDGACWRLAPREPLRLPGIPAHGARLVALRPVRPGRADLIASTLHFSQGGEVSRWQEEAGGLAVSIALGRVAEGELRLALPGKPVGAEVDGEAVALREAGEGVYRLAVRVNQTSELNVRWA
jgi:hypothetical protein